jgi:hypothetical protein
MTASNLCLHSGARLVSRTELEAIPAPQATKTWFPLTHASVLDRVLGSLGEAGFQARSVKTAVSRNDARFFGTIDLEAPLVTGVTLAVGVRNSLDKSLPIGFCAGHRTFVCDNLAFRSEVVIARKHTRFGETRFAEALTRSVQSLHQFREAEAQRVKRFQALPLSNEAADSLLLNAYAEGLVSHRLLPKVLQEWREPSFEEFSDRTLWSLFSAFTRVLGSVRESNPQRFAALTVSLQHFLDVRLGLGGESTKEVVLAA